MPALIKRFEEFTPILGNRVYIAETAAVIGDVELKDGVNIWYGSVIRGDVGKVRIEKDVNIQDLACVHMTKYISDAIIMEQASVGHSAIIHGAIVEAGALIGMGAIIMDNARIGEESIVAAGSLVTQRMIVPPRSMVMGRPAKVVRSLDDEEIKAGRNTAMRYVSLAEKHAAVAGYASSPI